LVTGIVEVSWCRWDCGELELEVVYHIASIADSDVVNSPIVGTIRQHRDVCCIGRVSHLPSMNVRYVPHLEAIERHSAHIALGLPIGRADSR
jgi:hypothetical protein